MSTFRPRPPRSLVVLVGGITIVPLLILVWLGWRLVEQDRALEQQQVRQRVERAADLVVTTLSRTLASFENQLESDTVGWPDGSVVVDFTDAGARVRAGEVSYLPAVQALPEASSSVFADGERLEFRGRSPASAAAWYRHLTESPNRAVAAGALVRRGRTLVKAGRIDEALAAYAMLANMNDVWVSGVPASLAGAYASGRVLHEQHREAELRTLGNALRRDLLRGRWAITGSAYRLYIRDANDWADPAPAENANEVLAEAVTTLWSRWSSTSGFHRDMPLRHTIEAGSRTFTVLARIVPGAYRVSVASPAVTEAQWLRPAQILARDHDVIVHLEPLVSSIDPSVRRAADSGLPWALRFSTVQPPPERSAFALRTRLLIAGFALLLTMAAAAGYFIIRAVARELTVARMQSEFVAAVSHEFRTPLTTLRQFTDMLREHPSLGAEARSTAYDAQARATERLTRLVESMLDFRRMEAGAHQYRFEPHDCTAMVRHIVDDYAGVARSSGHTVAFAGSERALVEGDEDALATAVRNLLDNAMKYSPQAEIVDVAVRRRNGDVRISVRDSGIGIPADERAHIFTKFHRGEQARTRGIKGTGIGLAMVRQIVEAHRGRVEVDSAQGAGSTFTIVLPARD
jgi:signal transduction histidine kinase